MRVLLAGSYAPSLLNFRGDLIRDLIAAGHAVAACAPDIKPTQRAPLEAMGATVIDTPLVRTGLDPRADLAYLATLRRTIREFGAQFLLAYTIKPNIWGAFAASREGIPSAAMVTGLGFVFTEEASSWRRKLVHAAATRLYRAANDRHRLVIFQNPDDRDDFIAAGCLRDPSKVRLTAGSGVDTDRFAAALLPDAPRFLMISRLLGNKGVREYAAAAVALKTSRPHAVCTLVGYRDEGPDGVSQAELDSWIECGLDYVGKLDDVRPAIAASSVYVLPSYREGTPRSVLEAMAMGRSVITTDAPGCRETVTHEHNGLLVPVRDVAALTKAMERLADNAAERTRMGANGREIAELVFDVQAVNRTLISHLDLAT